MLQPEVQKGSLDSVVDPWKLGESLTQEISVSSHSFAIIFLHASSCMCFILLSPFLLYCRNMLSCSSWMPVSFSVLLGVNSLSSTSCSWGLNELMQRIFLNGIKCSEFSLQAFFIWSSIISVSSFCRKTFLCLLIEKIYIACDLVLDIIDNASGGLYIIRY